MAKSERKLPREALLGAEERHIKLVEAARDLLIAAGGTDQIDRAIAALHHVLDMQVAAGFRPIRDRRGGKGGRRKTATSEVPPNALASFDPIRDRRGGKGGGGKGGGGKGGDGKGGDGKGGGGKGRGGKGRGRKTATSEALPDALASFDPIRDRRGGGGGEQETA